MSLFPSSRSALTIHRNRWSLEHPSKQKNEIHIAGTIGIFQISDIMSLLRERATTNAVLDVTVPSSSARTISFTVPAGVSSPSQLKQIAAARFEQIFRESPTEWSCRGQWSATSCVLSYLPRTLVQEVEDGARSCKMRVRSLKVDLWRIFDSPKFVKTHSVAIASDDSLSCVGFDDQGRLTSARTYLLREGSHKAAAAQSILLRREASASASIPVVGTANWRDSDAKNESLVWWVN